MANVNTCSSDVLTPCLVDAVCDQAVRDAPRRLTFRDHEGNAQDGGAIEDRLVHPEALADRPELHALRARGAGTSDSNQQREDGDAAHSKSSHWRIMPRF